MNPFAHRIRPQDGWVMPVSVLAVILGFMMASAWVTQKSRPSRISYTDLNQQDRISSGPIDLQLRTSELSGEVARLRDEKTQLENAVASQTGSSKLLNKELQDSKKFACLTDIEGGGIAVTLRDSQKPATGYIQDQIIHDGDVLRVVNELWNAGSNAIAVNGNRVAPTTSIRCVGSTILVNNTPVASPIVVRAIGDANTLTGALNLPGGVLSELRSVDPAMVQISPVTDMTITAFTGNTDMKYGKVPPASTKANS